MSNNVLPLFLFLFLLVLLAPTFATTADTQNPSVMPTSATATANTQKASVTFDYFVLSLTWPRSFCVIKKDMKDPCKDATHVPTDFTVHGLWPSLLKGQYINPKSCSQDKFKVKDLDPTIKRQAIQDWPDIQQNIKGTTKDIFSGFFWKKEWDKHGVCSNLNQNDYMELTLKTYHTLLPFINLAKRSLPYPRSTVDHSKFTKEILKESHFKPRLVCKNLTQPPYDQYMVEIQFNMTKYTPYGLQNAEHNSNCVSSIPVKFPQ